MTSHQRDPNHNPPHSDPDRDPLSDTTVISLDAFRKDRKKINPAIEVTIRDVEQALERVFDGVASHSKSGVAPVRDVVNLILESAKIDLFGDKSRRVGDLARAEQFGALLAGLKESKLADPVWKDLERILLDGSFSQIERGIELVKSLVIFDRVIVSNGGRSAQDRILLVNAEIAQSKTNQDRGVLGELNALQQHYLEKICSTGQDSTIKSSRDLESALKLNGAASSDYEMFLRCNQIAATTENKTLLQFCSEIIEGYMKRTDADLAAALKSKGLNQLSFTDRIGVILGAPVRGVLRLFGRENL